MLHIIPINDDHQNFHDFMAMVVLNQPQFSFNIALKCEMSRCQRLVGLQILLRAPPLRISKACLGPCKTP